MHKIYFYTLLFLLCSFTIQSEPRTGKFIASFDNNGITNDIYYYVPVDYNPQNAYPMLFAWHGINTSAGEIRDLLYTAIANDLKIIVVAPDTDNLTGQPSELLKNLITESYNITLENYNIDLSKLTITGSSLGGKIALDEGLLNPLKYKGGIIALSPAVTSFTQDMWRNVSAIKMAAVLGSLDFNYTPVNALMQDISIRGGSILYIVKEDVRHEDIAYYNSEDFISDYRRCYYYVTNQTNNIEDTKIDNSKSLYVYPNPATDYININTHKAIEIYDILGNLMKRSSGGLISITNLRPGVYLIKSEDSSIFFIKQ